MSATKEEIERGWEFVDSDTEGQTYTSRLRVFGGWVVKVTQWNSEHIEGMSTCFVPDPLHAWSL